MSLYFNNKVLGSFKQKDFNLKLKTCIINTHCWRINHEGMRKGVVHAENVKSGNGSNWDSSTGAIPQQN